MVRKIHLKHTDRYDNWHFGGPTNGVRSRLATEQFLELVDPQLITVTEPATSYSLIRRAVEMKVHEYTYVERVLDGYCAEWDVNSWPDHHPELAMLAVTMFNGTAELALQVRPGELGIHWQGAKHHAMYDQASGFCVFNDMAYAARLLANHGHHVFYLDWDAHHGDGVEQLTRSDKRITTFSIHERGIFPGTGLVDSPRENVYNRALAPGSGDDALVAAVTEALTLDYMAADTSIILLAAGADGAQGDPLSSLGYTLEGYREAAKMVGETARDLGARVIMGGAGGYRPKDLTPTVWAHTASALAGGMGLL
jgi:acetoin utilization protein AcuC